MLASPGVEEQDLGALGTIGPVAARDWGDSQGQQITSNTSNTRTATITPRLLLSLFLYIKLIKIDLTCIFFDSPIWYNFISYVNYYDFVMKPVPT